MLPRFFYPARLILDALMILPEPIAHHCRVLRLQIGQMIVLFNNEGGTYQAILTQIEKKEVTVKIASYHADEVELPYAVTLAQGIPEASKMDAIIEKAVELGVHTIQPLTTQRCVTRLTAERAAKRHHHWENIVIAASEQCGRNRLAHIAQLANIDGWIKQASFSTTLLLSPHAEYSLTDWVSQHSARDITLIVGPEGGLTASEEARAKDEGAVVLSMGRRILRTETAGLAALAMINAYWDR